MSYLIHIVIYVGTIAFMEGFSWFIHKYLFHGPLWFIHKTHHQPAHRLLELNDVFSLLFAGISLYLMAIGRPEFSAAFWIGAGIATYGIIYFIFHDWFIHNRLKPFKTKSKYLL